MKSFVYPEAGAEAVFKSLVAFTKPLNFYRLFNETGSVKMRIELLRLFGLNTRAGRLRLGKKGTVTMTQDLQRQLISGNREAFAWWKDKVLKGLIPFIKDLSHTDLSFCDLGGLDMRGVYANNANFYAAGCCSHRGHSNASVCESPTNMSRAHLYNCELELFCACKHSNFEGLHMLNCGAVDASLHEANFKHAVIKNTRLMGADLRNIDLSWAQVEDCDMSGADLRGANMNYAWLSFIDTTRANTKGLNLFGAQTSDLMGDQVEVLVAAQELLPAALLAATYGQPMELED